MVQRFLHNNILLATMPYFHSELYNIQLNFKVHYVANTWCSVMSHYEQSNAETGRSDADNYNLLPVGLHQIIITESCEGGAYDLQPNADRGLTEVQNGCGKLISQCDRVIREVWIHEYICVTLSEVYPYTEISLQTYQWAVANST